MLLKSGRGAHPVLVLPVNRSAKPAVGSRRFGRGNFKVTGGLGAPWLLRLAAEGLPRDSGSRSCRMGWVEPLGRGPGSPAAQCAPDLVLEPERTRNLLLEPERTQNLLLHAQGALDFLLDLDRALDVVLAERDLFDRVRYGS